MAAYRRIAHLDGLRAVAALAVVVQHVLEVSLPPASDGLATWLFRDGVNLGRYGVAVFFLISGYLIPCSIASHPSGLRDFAFGRAFRLYPLYWVSLAAALVLLPLVREQSVSPGTALANLTMLQTAFGFDNVIPLYWTLFVELIFYGLCAALAAIGLLHRRSTPSLAVYGFGIAMAVATLGHASGIGQIASAKLSTFAMYLQLMFLGYVVRMGGGRERLGPILATAASLAVYCAVRQWTGSYAVGLSPAQVFGSTAAAIATFLLAGGIRLLRRPTLRYLGAISFGIYLFHPLTAAVLRPMLEGAAGWMHAWWLLSAVVVTTVVVSGLAHEVIERPAIAVGQRVRRLWSLRPARPPDPGFEVAAPQDA